MLIDRNGGVVDLTPFAESCHDIDTALNWARCFAGSHADVAGMVILSTGHDDVTHPSEDDLMLFRTARSVFGEIGVTVHDWIQHGADELRSLAITSGQAAPWPAEDPS
ncbi:MAG: hypothetical protein ACRD0K_24010 [Egibacteraceae bacterium]